MLIFGEMFPRPREMGRKAATAAMYRLMRHAKAGLLRLDRSPRARKVALRLAALGALTPLMSRLTGVEA